MRIPFLGKGLLAMALLPAVAQAGVQDQVDVFDVLGLRPAGKREALVESNISLIPGPLFSVNPAAGTIWGVGTNVLFRAGDPKDTLLSTIDNLIAFTTKRQFIFYSRSTITSAQHTWEFIGDWRYDNFSQPTYGLGTDTDAAKAQPMKFAFVRVHETAFRRLAGNLFVGLGYHLDAYDNIEDQALDLESPNPRITTHYAYAHYHGFDSLHYTISGLSLNLLFESRDHVLDAYCGQFLLLSQTFNAEVLGSAKNSQVFYGEYRGYLPLDADPGRHLLGFWVLANLVTGGNVPYLDLPAMGYDMRNRSGRGYAQGRWRGEGLVYAETEYRFPILASGLLGGVAFVNATTVSSNTQAQAGSEVSLFHSIKPAMGAGLRIMALKSIRMNIAIDFAQGVDGSNGLYLDLFETF